MAAEGSLLVVEAAQKVLYGCQWGMQHAAGVGEGDLLSAEH